MVSVKMGRFDTRSSQAKAFVGPKAYSEGITDSLFSIAKRGGCVWKWFNELRKRRRRFQAAARQPVRDDEARAYFNAQRRAAVARIQGNGPKFTHWVKTALEIARISDANMDIRTSSPREIEIAYRVILPILIGRSDTRFEAKIGRSDTRSRF
jgi:hypothetical protein